MASTTPEERPKGDDRIVVVNSDCNPEMLDRIKKEALNATNTFNTHREMYVLFFIF